MTVKEKLNQYQGRKIFYKPNPGNGGDALIAAGTFKLFRECGLEVEIITGNDYSHLNGQIVLYAGGGNLVKEYTNCAEFIKKVHSYVEELIILPHTINSHEELLASLKENVTIFVREKTSYEILNSNNPRFKLLLDHDMAFNIKVGDYDLNSFFSLATQRLIEYKMKNIFMGGKKKELNAFRVDVEKTDIKLPNNNIDVSVKINHSSSMYPETIVQKTTRDIFQFVDSFDNISTNRLHIAIASALLGKTVKMYKNSYYKNRAIFDFSLKDSFSNVKFYEE